MDKDRLINHLKFIAQTAIGMETDLKHLDLLELEILAIKTNIQGHRKVLRLAVCSILGMIEGEDWANRYFGWEDYQQLDRSKISTETTDRYSGNLIL